MAREKCKWEAANPPDGIIKFLRGSNSDVKESISSSKFVVFLTSNFWRYGKS